MGLRIVSYNYLLNALKYSNVKNIKNATICELGNTQIRPGLRRNLGRKHNGKQFYIAKDYFQFLGAKSVSIDINGKNGALAIDLGRKIHNHKLKNKFDIILNAGTSEHIQNQKTLFQNISYLCKKDGVAVHTVPHKSKLGHGLFQYDKQDFERICKAENWLLADYRVSVLYKKTPYVFCTMIKK